MMENKEIEEISGTLEQKLLFYRNQQIKLSNRLKAINFKKLTNSDLDLVSNNINIDELLKNRQIVVNSKEPYFEIIKDMFTKSSKQNREIGRFETYIALGFAKDTTTDMMAPLLLQEVTIQIINSHYQIVLEDTAVINKLAIYKKLIATTNIVPDQNMLEEEFNLNSSADIYAALTKINTQFGLNYSLSNEYQQHNYDALADNNIALVAVIAFMPKTISSTINDYNQLLANPSSISKTLERLVNKNVSIPNSTIDSSVNPTFVSSNESQDKIIRKVLAGNDMIIQGPPGTGKSQVIVNLIFNLMKNQKRILMISEKKTAIDVVDKRIGELNNYAMYANSSNDKQLFFERIKQAVSNRSKLVGYQAAVNLNINTAQANYAQTEAMVNAVLKTVKYNDATAPVNGLDIISLGQVVTYLESPNVANIKPKQLNQMTNSINNYINTNNKKDLYVVEQISNNGKLSLIDKVKWIFTKKKYNPTNAGQILSKALELNQAASGKNIATQNSISNVEQIKGMINSELSKINTSELVNQLTKNYSEYTTINNQNALEKVRQTLNGIDINNAFVQVSNLKTYPRKSIFNFVKEKMDSLNLFFPIWIMSVDAVSELLPQQAEMFDYVIVDEASQVEYSKILPILNRAKNYIIVGDKNQLQPSQYFISSISTDAITDEQLLSEIEDFEEGTISIIDFAARATPAQGLEMLTNHYRSADQKLIEFSNVNFYENKINVVSKMDFVTQNPIEVIDVNGKFDSASGINQQEVDQIISTIQSIMQNQPKKSIGIIVMNKTMEKGVEKAIAAQASKDPAFAKMLNDYTTNGLDELIVKNLETIQGDERDYIILALTYGKVSDTRINSLGPISYSGGENRINVAITRSKEKMFVIKSLKASDVNLDVKHSQGRQTFSKYINYLDQIASAQQINGNVATPLTSQLSQIFLDYNFKEKEGQGKYLIDIVVENKQGQKLGGIVKIDGLNKNDLIYAAQFFNDRMWKIEYCNNLNDINHVISLVQKIIDTQTKA